MELGCKLSRRSGNAIEGTTGEWTRLVLPAFLTIVLMPFTYSITNGIGIGFLSFCVLRLVAGRGKEVPVALYAVAAVFAFYYLMPALGLT